MREGVLHPVREIFCNYRVSYSAIPRLVLAGAVKAHIVNHAKNSHAHGGQNRAEGGREEARLSPASTV